MLEEETAACCLRSALELVVDCATAAAGLRLTVSDVGGDMNADPRKGSAVVRADRRSALLNSIFVVNGRS